MFFDIDNVAWYDISISEGVAAAWRDSQHTGFGTVHSKPGLPRNSETHVHSFTVHGGLFFVAFLR